MAGSTAGASSSSTSSEDELSADDDDGVDDVDSSPEASRSGRSPSHNVQEADLRECCEAGMTETVEISAALGLTASQIKTLKARWGLQGVAEASPQSVDDADLGAAAGFLE